MAKFLLTFVFHLLQNDLFIPYCMQAINNNKTEFLYSTKQTIQYNMVSAEIKASVVCYGSNWGFLRSENSSRRKRCEIPDTKMTIFNQVRGEINVTRVADCICQRLESGEHGRDSGIQYPIWLHGVCMCGFGAQRDGGERMQVERQDVQVEMQAEVRA